MPIRHFFRCKPEDVRVKFWVYGSYEDPDNKGLMLSLPNMEYFNTIPQKGTTFEYLGWVSFDKYLEKFKSLVGDAHELESLKQHWLDQLICAFAKGKRDDSPHKVSILGDSTHRIKIDGSRSSFVVDLYRLKPGAVLNLSYCVTADVSRLGRIFVCEKGVVKPQSDRFILGNSPNVLTMQWPHLLRSLWQVVDLCQGDFGRVIFAPIMEQVIAAFEQGEEGPHPLLQGE